MIGGIYIIFSLHTIPYSSSARGPDPNHADKLTINIRLDESKNEKRSYVPSSQLQQLPTPSDFSSDYSNNENNNGYEYGYGKYNRYGTKGYAYRYEKNGYGRYGTKVDPVVKIKQGVVVGWWDSSEKGRKFKSFQGIPYGTVEQRFKRAVKAARFENGLFLAKQDGPRCPQRFLGNISEDCLSINVFVPNEGRNLPVMIWIHGGSFVSGSGGKTYYGPQFLVDYGVIVVTFNYRLGSFGFLSLETEEAPGNMALWDQNLALDWVNENIEHFGGDKTRITIFGESSGSLSVMYHLVSLKSSGLFSAAICQSGALFSTYPHPQRPGHARRVALNLASSLGCQDGTDQVLMSCLREKSMEEIVKNQNTYCDDCNQNTYCFDQDGHICTLFTWNSVIDGPFSRDPFLPDLPENIAQNGNYNKVPVIIGVTSEEGIYYIATLIKNTQAFSRFNNEWHSYGPLALFDKIENVTDVEREVSSLVRSFYLGNEDASMENIHGVIDLVSDAFFWSGTHHFIKLAVGQQTAPIYQYILTYKGTNSYADLVLGIDSDSLGLGVCHVDDLYYLFKNYRHNLTFNEDDMKVREAMLTWWTNFAKNHSPDNDDLWKRVEVNNHKYLNVGLVPHMEYDQRYANRMDFWTQIQEKLNK